MEPVLVKLKHDHEVLLQALKTIKDQGIGTPEGRTQLFRAKEALVAHLQSEDQWFYPALDKAAEQDADLKATVTRFAEEMKQIGQEVMAFFGKYAQASSGIEFARDFGKLCSLLQGRIIREESILFPAFEKAQTKSGRD